MVQIGDVLDRGDEELEVLALLRALKREAAAQGGRVITLLGNHEVMNAAGITAYVSPRSAAKFGAVDRAELRCRPRRHVGGDARRVHDLVVPEERDHAATLRRRLALQGPQQREHFELLVSAVEHVADLDQHTRPAGPLALAVQASESQNLNCDFA